MIKKLLFVALLIIIGISITNAQLLNYQGIARNANGVAISFQDISIRLSIRDISASGATLYSETRLVRTNQFGLINLVIGSPGAISTIGSIGSINWASNSKFLQVEIDPSGGTNFLNAGTSQLQSVPYAFFATAAYPVGSAGGDLLGSTYPNPIIATFAVTTNKLNDEAVTNEKIKDAAVNNAKIADGTIQNIKLVNSSITLNGLALDLGSSQSFAIGNSGVDFNISSLGSVHTFNLPTASSTVRGLLSTTNFTNFNTAFINRITSLTTTGPNGPATLASNILNIPTYALPAATATTLGGTIIGANISNTGGTISLSNSNITSALGSQPSNLVLASPNGAAGIPSFRALVATDIPVLPIAQGGTSATTKAAFFNALSPMTNLGDIIYGGVAGTGTRLATGTNGQILTLTAGLIPSWSTPASNNQWSIFGNSGLNAGTNFLGTTNNVSLNFKVESVNSGIITTQTGAKFNTSLGLGTSIFSNTGAEKNSAFGAGAMSSITTGKDNTAVGQGTLSLNTISDNNTAIGQSALANTTGTSNTAVGQAAMQTNTSGVNNTVMGKDALFTNLSGQNNTAIGHSAARLTTGSNNTAIGQNSLNTNTFGSNNTAIGFEANVSAIDLMNATAIGNGAIVNAINTVQLGNTSVTKVNTSGTMNASKFVGNSSGTSLTYNSTIIDNATLPIISGNDVAGYITFTTGASPNGIGDFITVTFGSPYTLTSPIVLIQPVINTGTRGITTSIYCLPSATILITFVISTGIALLANTDYQIAYHVLGR